MECPGCRHDNPPHAKFCLECGTRMALSCVKCQAELPPSAKFCLECGQRVTASGTGSRFATPDAYTPKHLAARILTSKAALEGERKQVTVLFADIKGSMELLADRDPEEARRILDPVLERMMEAVHRYEGTVNQVMGDGIMALFGAPLAHEDHAVRACYAALRMQESVKQLMERSQGSLGTTVRIRIGLNSGDVVVRSIGSDLKMDYTAVGLTTHLAARMEQMATPGTILLSPHTAGLAEGFIQAASLGVMSVKGLTEPVEVFELTGEREAGSRLVAGAAHGLTRFTGRDLEIEQLERALERARFGQGQVAAVFGEPGVGKSRLLLEFTDVDLTRDWKVLQGRAVSYGKTTAFLPVIHLFKSYFGIETRDSDSTVREKIRSRLLALAEGFTQEAVSPFEWLFDVAGDDADWRRLDSSQRRQRVLDACLGVLLHESQRQPLLVVFEDLHWIDSETQMFLDTLVASLPSQRMLLLVNYRPEYSHGWGSKTYYNQVRLDPLRAASVDDLLGSLVGTAPDLEPIRRFLSTRTDGNPFFLEESVRTLVETRMLIGQRGEYHVGAPFEGMRIPSTVQSLLAARIDRLHTEDKELLQAASVVGKDVALDVLAGVVDTLETDLDARLRRLREAEFLYETRRFPSVEYTFKHALTHEVAYGSLLHDTRRALHAKLVEVIERLYGDRLNEHVESLARHSARGELWPKAVHYLRHAGVKALQRSASREATWYLEQALDAVTHLPATREAREVAIDIRFFLRTALFVSGDLHRIEPHLIQAGLDAAAIDDSSRVGWVAAYHSIMKWHQGDSRAALDGARRASELGARVPDLFLQVYGQTVIAYSSFCLGEYTDTQAACHDIIGLLPGDLARRTHHSHAVLPVVAARHYLAISKAEVGAFDDGLADASAGVRVAEELRHPWSITMAQWSMAYVHRLRGDLASAAASLESTLTMAREHKFDWWLAFGAWLLGNVHAHRGHYDDGIALLNEAQDVFQSRSMNAFRDLALVHLAEARLLAGERAEASRVVNQAKAQAIDRGERGFEGWARRVSAEIALADGRLDLAEAELQAALAVAGELNMRPLLAMCHNGLATVWDRLGAAERAAHHAETAVAMGREMGMLYWLNRV